jgi:ElaB/YqjD/DUF883 family membrane-anchored ribosome-binding protein
MNSATPSTFPTSASDDKPATPAATATTQAKPLLDSVVRGVHDTVDRVAATAAPAVERLVGGVNTASDAAQQRAREVNELGHEWAETLRATVREHPLASLAVALAVGVLVSRVASGDGH